MFLSSHPPAMEYALNLYILDRDPRQIGALMCDQDVLNRALSLAQLLVAVHARYDNLTECNRFDKHRLKEGGAGAEVYNPMIGTSMSNDPTQKIIDWAGDAIGNYHFVRRMLNGVLNEYQRRYGDARRRKHKTWSMYYALREAPRGLRAKDLETPYRMTSFVRQTHEDDGLGYGEDIVITHRCLYREARASEARYCLDNKPDFMKL